MHRHITCFFVATLFLLGSLQAGTAGTGHPPVLQCEYESDLSVPGYRFEEGNLCFWVPSDRGYESLYVALSPADKAKGQCLVAWDISSGRSRVIVDDLNALAGSTPKEGWRFLHVLSEHEKHRGWYLVFSLSSSEGSGVIRFNMPEHAFSPFSKGPAGMEIIRLSGHGARVPVALLRKPGTQEYALHRIKSRQQEEAPVCRIAEVLHKGGAELQHFFHAATANKIYIPGGPDGKATELFVAGRKVRRNAVEMSEAQQALLQGRMRLLLDNQQIIGPRYYMLATRQYVGNGETGTLRPMQWSRTTLPTFGEPLPGADAFVAADGPVTQLSCFKSMIPPIDYLRRHLGEEAAAAFDQEVFAHTPWRDGAIFRATKPADGKQHLQYLAPATGKVKDVGIMTDAAGAPLETVHWLGSDTAGMVLSLGTSEGKLLAQAWCCPFLDSLRAVAAEARKRFFAGRKHAACKLEVIDSFHAYGNEQDRGWDPFLTASDGNIYLGAMPHHPVKSTRIWRYRMGDGKLTDYGAFDERAGLTGEKRIPSMMHCFPIELDGKVYFVGQDPFYGKRRFPTLPADVGYAGSTVLALDLKTQKIESIGVPIPGGSLHGILPAYTHDMIYMKNGYRTKNWYSYDVATKKMRQLPIPPVDKMQHIDPQGRMWMVDKEGKVQCYDPATDKVNAFGTVGMDAFPGAKWIGRKDRQRKRHPEKLPNRQVRFVRATMGSAKAIGYLPWCEGVVELDTTTGKVRAIGRMRPDTKEFPLAEWSEGFRAFDVVGGRFIGLYNKRKPKHVELHTMDLASGKANSHGMLSDRTGRIVQESNCMAVGGDGRIYVTATVFNNPGDMYYSHRFAWANAKFFDTVFARIDLNEMECGDAMAAREL